MSEYLLGIDGGGTKTLALLASANGATLGRGQAPSSNYHKVGKDAALAALDEAIRNAFADAQLALEPVAAICLGMSGVDRPEDLAVFQPWLADHHGQAKAVIVNDAELVLAAGTPDGWGVAAICGTGAICVGRNRAGERARADGWGNILGDAGSGYAIGLAALRAVMRAYDGRGNATALSAAILGHWSLETPVQIVHRVYTQQATPTEIAALAALVDKAAEQGDWMAIDIIRHAAAELVTTIHAVASRLAFSGPVPCGLAGGVITKSKIMATRLAQAAHGSGLRLAPIQIVDEPAQGALRLAQRALAF
jgi:N-acetylmuramic acid 6-phosphate etherase